MNASMDASPAIPVAQVHAPGGPFHAIDLPRMAARHGVALAAMPYVLRVLLENMCRHALWSGGERVSMAEVEGLLRWRDTVGASCRCTWRA